MDSTEPPFSEARFTEIKNEVGKELKVEIFGKSLNFAIKGRIFRAIYEKKMKMLKNIIYSN